MMQDLNQKILEAVRNEHADTIPQSEIDISMMQLFLSSFRGSFRFMMIGSIFLMAVFFALAVYCAIYMIPTDDLGDKIEWLAGLILSATVFMVVRLWFFMELNRLSVLREIKRVELQVALLSEQLSLR